MNAKKMIAEQENEIRRFEDCLARDNDVTNYSITFRAGTKSFMNENEIEFKAFDVTKYYGTTMKAMSTYGCFVKVGDTEFMAKMMAIAARVL